MQFHPVADIFPMMSATEFEALKKSIAANGQRLPVYTHENQIVDGRNRYRACIEIGRLPWLQEWNGEGLLVDFVWDLNAERRQLVDGALQIAAGKYAIEREVEARKRQLAQLNNSSVPTGTDDEFGYSRQKAAEKFGLGEQTVARAVKVVKEGTPELVQAVERGQASVSAAAEVATLPKVEQQQIVARGEVEILRAAKEIKAKKTEERRQERITKIVELAEQPVESLLSKGRFPLIYADPPWRYDFSKDDADEVENHYPTMELSEICALPVGDSALDDCVLFLWATSPKLEESFRVIAAWGFTYRTCAVWDKEWIGPGYYFRQRHELLLIATRGNVPVPKPESRPDSIFTERRTAHSRKPEIAYRLLEQMYPELPKLELFAREQRAGWHAWGNQAQGRAA